METEIRTRRSPLMDQMLDGVKLHAKTNYEAGWDVVVETMDDEQLVAAIGYCRSTAGAVAKIAKMLDLQAAVRHDVRAASGEYDDVPPPAPVALLDEAPTGSIAGDLRALEEVAAKLAAEEQMTLTGAMASFVEDNDTALQLTASLPAGKPRRRKQGDVMVAFSQFCHCAKPKLDDADVCKCGTQWIKQ